ncbi:MAG TPA: FAD-dependent oxidoreductase [Bryobacteraceae bacterium]|jgi:hypothetical protein
MNRRNFLGAAIGGYSLVYSVDRAAAATLPDDPVRPNFERIAPGASGLAHSLAAEPNMRLVRLEADICVAGGGLAGVCAAVAAARNGAKVVLLQDRSRLGGNSSSEVKMHVVGANCHKGRPGWRDSGLIEEIRLDDAVGNPQRSFELWDLLLYDKVIHEPNITLLLETTLYSARMEGSAIREVLARCDKSEHLYQIKAKIFCDCTGDSRLALESGAQMRTGRETRAEFNESLAPEHADNETLGSSILFTSRLYHKAMPFTPPSWARKVTKQQLFHRDIESWEYGYWWIEWGGNLDTIHDNERIRFELLSIVMGVWDYIKNSGNFPSSANWAMDWVGMMPGRRGSRRVMGDYILTQHDLEKGRHEDAVAIGGWPMDDHPPGGFDRSDLPPNVAIRPPEVYDIPLRCLYSKNVSNLMLAGRNISASHVAFTSARVMATCSVIGQAVGTAAAHCAEHGLEPRELAHDANHVQLLRQNLLRDDQTIKGARNQDPRDLARLARVSASRELPTAKASNVLDGYTRNIPDKHGRPVEIHYWAAALDEQKPEWIELRWEQPQSIGQIQITFDSGFQRELTLSASDSVNVNIVRGPQPETVKAYSLSYVSPSGANVPLIDVNNNHQRVRRHRFDKFEASAIRCQVRTTNGAEEARIFEIRCYA